MTYIIPLAVAILAFASALPATAETFGCWFRAYDSAHLASHPDQVAATIWLSIYPSSDRTEPDATLSVVTANGGHVAEAGLDNRYFTQELFCFTEPRGFACGVECDGGSFRVSHQDDDVIEITTDYLRVGEGEECGGHVDLAESYGKDTTYRLYRTDDAACEQN